MIYKINSSPKFEFKVKKPKSGVAFRFFLNYFFFISKLPLTTLSEMINSAYITFIPLICMSIGP